MQAANNAQGTHVSGTILINTSKPKSKEIDAYSHAAGQRGSQVSAAGSCCDDRSRAPSGRQGD